MTMTPRRYTRAVWAVAAVLLVFGHAAPIHADPGGIAGRDTRRAPYDYSEGLGNSVTGLVSSIAVGSAVLDGTVGIERRLSGRIRISVRVEGVRAYAFGSASLVCIQVVGVATDCGQITGTTAGLAAGGDHTLEVTVPGEGLYRIGVVATGRGDGAGLALATLQVASISVD